MGDAGPPEDVLNDQIEGLAGVLAVPLAVERLAEQIAELPGQVERG